jgi:Mycothiol maleylpyruvate isomerase N-terminal domain
MSTPTTVPGLDRDTAMRLAAEEVRRYADLLDKLDEEQWAAATECEPWTVRDMAGHVLAGPEPPNY